MIPARILHIDVFIIAYRKMMCYNLKKYYQKLNIYLI